MFSIVENWEDVMESAIDDSVVPSFHHKVRHFERLFRDSVVLAS